MGRKQTGRVYAIGGQGAASVTTLSASGAAALGSTLSVAGAAALNGGVNCDGGKFTIANTTGATIISGTLTGTGAVSFASTLGVTGASTLTGGGTAGANFDAAGHRIGALYVGVYTNSVLDGYFVRTGANLDYVYAPGGTPTYTNQIVDDVTQ